MHVEEIERSVLDCRGLGIFNRKEGKYLSWIGMDRQNSESEDSDGRFIKA